MTTDQVMVASHDHRLVLLSICVSILAAYAALALVERLRDARGRTWLAWLVGGAVVDGIGTWSMHYTGKLALRLPVPIEFDWPLVLLSLLVAVVGSGATLLVVGRGKMRWPRALAASIILGGIGISGMHYTAMAAMRMPPVHDYSPSLVILSVLVAIAVSLMALTFSVLFLNDASKSRWRYHGSAVLRGAANPIMHYTAMAAVTFALAGEAPDLSHAVSISSLGLLGISVVPVMVLVVALLTSLADRLHRQRTLLDELFEQAPQAVALMDVDYRVVRVNREFTGLFGYCPKEAVGRQLLELTVPDEAQDEVQGFIETLARGQQVDAVGIRQRKDGSRLYVSIVHVPVSLPGGQVAVYAIYRDISERKQAEDALQQAQSRIESVLSSVADIHILFDREWRYLYVNEAAVRAIGRPQEQILGSTLWEMYPDIIGTELGRQYRRAMEERIFVAFDFHYLTTDTWWENRFYPTREGLSVFGTDITERKRAEEQIRTTTEQLRALSARLQSAREEEGTRIAREIHDEMGSALTSLRWELESFDNSISKLGEQAQLQKLREKIESMLKLTETTISAVRRITSELRPSVLDDLGLIEALEWHAQQFQARTGLICQCDCSLDNLDLNQEQTTAIFRIFQEALTNILRHAQATRVEITTAQEDGEFVLTISDNGRGITTSEKSGTQSLGLLGMHERAHLIGARLEITGVEGKGTVVTLRVLLNS